MFMKTFQSLLVAGIFSMLMMTCGKDQNVKMYKAFTSMKLNDTLITEAVEDEISYHPEVPVNEINVKTEDNIVILSGTTDNLLAKNRAEEVASQVIGVKGIINHIVVRPDSVTDDELLKRVEGGLYYDPTTNLWQMKVKVKNGNVFLSGQVNSWEEIQFAGDVAESIRGVKSVTNDLTFKYDSLRPDEQIYYDIKRIFLTDARLDHTLIDVKVDTGAVELWGIVGSLPEKSLAISDAWVDGVKSVDASNLEVKYWARDPRLRLNKYAAKPDSEIISSIQTALYYDYRVNDYDVNVDANGGYVKLTGTVTNLQAKNAAGEDANNIVGVWSVDNMIKIQPNAEYSDNNVLGRVKAAFKNDPYLKKYDLKLNVFNGRLYIEGMVDSPYEKILAEKLGERIPGVTDIKDNLTVSGFYNQYSNKYYKYNNYPVFEEPKLLPDNKILTNIEHEFWKSPFLNGDEIAVDVRDGHVTLTGKVETYLEKKLATKEAYEGGAFTVTNDIRVMYWPHKR